MAGFGYGYTRQEVVDLGTDYAIQLGLRDKAYPLTLKWFRGFISRWPALKVNKPRSLEMSRAKCASVTKVDNYFSELKVITEKYGFDKEPQLIYNVDEKGFSQCHSPPSVVCSGDAQPPAVTAGKSSTITVIGCGNATGAAVPPFIISPGKRMLPKLLDGATPGTTGRMSDSGWSNSELFRDYLENHFLRHVPINVDQKVLLLLDGHKSHASVGLSQWAKERGIIIFVLPAHTSHIIQPLDVACYGPLQKIFNNECHKFIRGNHGTVVRDNMCGLICKSYSKALSTENLISAFKKTGIHPLDREQISNDCLKPAEVFVPEEEVDNDPHGPELADEDNFFTAKEVALRVVKSEHCQKERKTMSKIVSGHCITEEEVIDQMIEYEANQAPAAKKRKENNSQDPSTSGSSKVPKKEQKEKEKKLNVQVVDEDEDDSEVVGEVAEKDLCCVCKLYSPVQLHKNVGFTMLKWVQCDGHRNGMPCLHWVHLRYCCKERVVRRGVEFLCPHCAQ